MKATLRDRITLGSYPNRITNVVAVHIAGIDVNLMEPGGPVLWLALEAERIVAEAVPEEPGFPSDPDADPPVIGRDTVPAQPARAERVALPNVEWRGAKLTQSVQAALTSILIAGYVDLQAEGLLPMGAKIE